MRPQASRPYTPRRPLRPRQADALSVAVQNGLHGSRFQQQGVSLMELLLVAGVIAAGTAVIYNVYQNVNAASKVDNESGNLRALTKNVMDSYSASEDYGSLTTERAMQDKLFPNLMMSSGQPTSSWGKPVRVLATDISRNGSTLQNWGFVVAYDDVPAKACVDLISQAGPEFNDIRVEGTSIGVGANLNVARMSQLCNRSDGADIQFVFERSALQNPDGALTLCSDSLPSAPETQVVSCPAGQYGLLRQSRSAFCSSSYGSFQWTPWSTTSQTCSPCPAPETRVSTQTLTCPTGQAGVWTQSRNESRSANCPLPGPNGPSELTSWNAWTATSSWATVTNTCAPICVLPSPSAETRWTAQSAACPTGQAGHNTWEREERRTASCPPLAPGYSVPVGSYSWSAWTASGTIRGQDNTCATCPSPGSQTLACPSGQVGSIIQSRSYTCSGEGSWGNWTTTSNTCTTCPSPESRTQACPSGQVGTISQSRSYTCSGQGSWGNWTTTSNTCTTCPAPETRTLSCPSGQVGSIAQSRAYSCSGTGSWGTWTTTSNSCTACPAPETQTQGLSCPSFQTGGITQQRTRSFACSGTGSWGDWSAWSTTSNTCALPACDGTVAGNARNYMARYPDLAQAFYGTHPGGANWNQDYNQAYAHWYNGGYYEGRQSCWGAPCTLPNPSTQTEYNQYSELRQFACPAGQYGPNPGIDEWRTVYQSRNRSASCPAPTGSFTWGNWTGWNTYAYGDWVRTANHCNNCPAPWNDTSDDDGMNRWVDIWEGCPAGQVGNVYYQKEQRQTRPVTYNCPAGTTSIPGPTWGAWRGDFSDTGATRNYQNSCTPACTAPAPGYQYADYNVCPSGQYVVSPGTQRRTVSWSCPGPTATYGNWERISFPQCCRSGRRCQIN